LLKPEFQYRNDLHSTQRQKQDNWIRGRGESTKKLNDTLAYKLNSLKGENEALKTGKKTQVKKASFNNTGVKLQDFIVYLNRIIQRFESAGSIRTAKRYRSLKNKLVDYENDSIPFDSITVTF
jgi:hypothetical protein